VSIYQQLPILSGDLLSTIVVKISKQTLRTSCGSTIIYTSKRIARSVQYDSMTLFSSYKHKQTCFCTSSMSFTENFDL